MPLSSGDSVEHGLLALMGTAWVIVGTIVEYRSRGDDSKGSEAKLFLLSALAFMALIADVLLVRIGDCRNTSVTLAALACWGIFVALLLPEMTVCNFLPVATAFLWARVKRQQSVNEGLMAEERMPSRNSDAPIMKDSATGEELHLQDDDDEEAEAEEHSGNTHAEERAREMERIVEAKEEEVKSLRQQTFKLEQRLDERLAEKEKLQAAVRSAPDDRIQEQRLRKARADKRELKDRCATLEKDLTAANTEKDALRRFAHDTMRKEEELWRCGPSNWRHVCRRRASLFHPDSHWGLPDDVRAQAEEVVKLITSSANAAYDDAHAASR